MSDVVLKQHFIFTLFTLITFSYDNLEYSDSHRRQSLCDLHYHSFSYSYLIDKVFFHAVIFETKTR